VHFDLESESRTLRKTGKNPEESSSGFIEPIMGVLEGSLPRMRRIVLFFLHPDFTVGPGVQPDLRFRARGLAWLLTAGRVFHPSLKKL
jgi:hypothetical protein